MSTVTKEELEEFALSAEGFFGFSQTEQIDYFLYFLSVKKSITKTSATLIRECYVLLDLLPYAYISQYLTNNLKKIGKIPPKFLRTKEGFQLHRERRLSIEATLKTKPLKAKATSDLSSLLSHVTNPNENEFLKEAISCFEIEAYRASIVMVWNLTIDHLFEFILKHELANFNTALSKNTDKRIKITSVSKKDDFSEIPEGKFIEFCKSGGIITNDVRKILDTKLGIRNSYAHPSSLKMLESKAVEFIEDLVNNVVLKYSI
ncbi:hypothetical protein PDL71_01520 [Lacibacter sp. MH-610]|uniref:hypothetical protein n=1 Tax=Lacibacter sp. MH-610 TaxID=3020883 RepID=UPI0038913AA8